MTEYLWLMFYTILPSGVSSLPNHLARVRFEILGRRDKVVTMRVRCPRPYEAVPYNSEGEPIVPERTEKPTESGAQDLLGENTHAKAQCKEYERLHREHEREAIDRDAERKRYDRETADRDAEIRQLKQSLATTKVYEKKDDQLKFDFRLYTKPGDWTSMEMVFASASNVVAVPFIGIVVSNKAERHIEVVKYHLSKVNESSSYSYPTDVVIGPMHDADVDATKPVIQLLAGLRKPDWEKIFGLYQVEVAVECRGEPTERPLRSASKMFDLQIARTGRMALDVTISPHRS
jgi:hypothetical protein